MRFQIELTSAAQADIKAIWQYISEDSVANANKFIAEIEKQVFSLELMPKRCQYINENEILEGNYRQLLFRRYRIIFRIINNTVNIIRVVHGMRLLEPLLEAEQEYEELT